ncbi:shikimate kinase [bacterium]|nr:shikimate kinase [bacterium]
MGKTKIGRLLSVRLNYKFVDTDDCIVKEAGMSVPEIFETRGEPAFRLMEKQWIARVARQKKQVVSLGGGAVVDPENWERITASGITVSLSYTPEIILRRANLKTDRPLLNQETEAEKMDSIKTLLNKRKDFYQRANVVIHLNKEIEPDRVADMIAGYLGVWQ